jgi:hypothetical protein
MNLKWRQYEPTLEDILSDCIIKAVMKADGVDPHQLAAMLKEVGGRWAGPVQLPSSAREESAGTFPPSSVDS